MKFFNFILKQFIFGLIISTIFLNEESSFAQNTILQNTNAQKKNPFPVKYVSPVDQNLFLKSVTLAPVYDNSQGIYKKAVEDHLNTLIQNDYFWSYSEFKSDKNQIRIDEFDNDSSAVLKVLDKSRADALMTSFIVKGPQGIKIYLNLYTKDQGLLLLQETFEDSSIFEIVKVKEIIEKMYSQIKVRLPYSGLVFSRQGSQVTLNLGVRQKLKAGDILTIAQVLKINRHPKLNFMIGVEKEILGRVQVKQVESELSIGEVIFEKESGVIEKGAKIISLNGVDLTDNKFSKSDNSNILSGDKNPVEWLPAPVPQFGKLTLATGFSNFSDSAVLVTGQNIQAKSNFGLTFLLGAEFWLTPDYYASIEIQQISLNAKQDLAGSSPEKLNYTLNRTNALFGYRYLIDGNFWGPQLFSSIGYLSHSVKVSDSSPTAFNSFDVSGVDLTVGALFPVSEKNDMAVGGQAKFLFNEKMSERTVSSGNPKASYNHFDLFGTYQYTTNINFKAQISLINIQAEFSGAGSKNPASRSLDEKITSYLFGIEYLF